MTFKTIFGAGCTLVATDTKGVTHIICVSVAKDAATGEYRARIISPVACLNNNVDYFADDKNEVMSTARVRARVMVTAIAAS